MLFFRGKQRILDANGRPVSGAKANFYLTTTSTRANIYQNAALSTPHTNPVEADSAGFLPPIYLSSDITYRCEITDSAGGSLPDGIVDPVNPSVLAGLNPEDIGGILYPRTPAEIAVVVTPTDYAHAPLVLERQATNTTPGTTDVTAALISELLVAKTAGNSNLFGTVEVNGAIAISSTVIVDNGVTLDLKNNPVTPLSTSLNMFEVRPGGQIRNLRVNVEGIAYTGTVATLKGDGGAAAGFQGSKYRPWLVGFSSRMALDTTNGRHIYLDATSQYLQEFQASRINVSGGGRGIHLFGTDAGALQYAQGNVFADVVMFGCNKFIWCEGDDTAGNIFTGLLLQQRVSNPVGKVVLESAANYLQGKAWDDVAIEASADGNVIDILQSQAYGPAITDTARNTFSRSRGVQYLDGRSINTYGDWRHELNGPGTIEFRDQILGGFDPRWGTEVTSGSPTANFGFATFGAAAAHKQASPYMRITCAPAAESYTRNFGGNGFLKCAQKPTVHFTVHPTTGDQRLRWMIGLYTDANNYIVLTQDQTTYSDDDIRFITRSGGTSTTKVLSTVGSDHVNYCSLLINETSVIALVKQYNNAGTGATGRVADGALWTGSLFVTDTSTTNIPTTSAMFPYLLVQQGSGGNSAVLDILHYSVVAGAKSIVA
jgi:hypothetical protein